MLTKDLMTSKVVTVGPGNSIWHAAQKMLDHDVSGLPVVDDSGRLAGMITQGDLLHRIELGTQTTSSALEQRLGAYVKAHSWNVGDVMTAKVISAEENTPIHSVATLMDRHRIRRMPVVREGKLIGIISRKDLLRVVATARRDTIPPGSDAMRRAIMVRLAENPDLRCAQVTVTVSGGIVHLGGTIGSDAERNAARVTAESVRGVEGVCDHMQILASASRSAASKLSDQ